MTRKDYIAIAAALSLERPALTLEQYAMAPDWDRGTFDEWNTIVLRFAGMLAADNPRFDRAKFLTACGV